MRASSAFVTVGIWVDFFQLALVVALDAAAACVASGMALVPWLVQAFVIRQPPVAQGVAPLSCTWS